MRTVLPLAVLMILGLLVTACDTFTKTSDDDIDVVQATAELKDMLADKDTVLIDVRPTSRWANGYIPGSIHIPHQQLIAEDARLAEFKNIVVYGTDMADYLPRASVKKLLALGYKNVHLYAGGAKLWADEGGTLEKDATATAPASQPATGR